MENKLFVDDRVELNQGFGIGSTKVNRCGECYEVILIRRVRSRVRECTRTRSRWVWTITIRGSRLLKVSPRPLLLNPVIADNPERVGISLQEQNPGRNCPPRQFVEYQFIVCILGVSLAGSNYITSASTIIITSYRIYIMGLRTEGPCNHQKSIEVVV